MLKACSSFAVYLSFNGNCRQAFSYYQACFGGELTVQTLADTAMGANMCEQMSGAVVYATLSGEHINLAGTDLTEPGGVVSGNQVGILIQCHSPVERARFINKLLGRNFCAFQDSRPLIHVTDMYGVRWILAVS